MIRGLGSRVGGRFEKGSSFFRVFLGVIFCLSVLVVLVKKQSFRFVGKYLVGKSLCLVGYERGGFEREVELVRVRCLV